MSFLAKKMESTLSEAYFIICFIIIFGVAARDVYWSIAIQKYLLENELNPVGRWLIQTDQGSVALFMSLKAFGMALGASFLTYMHLLNFRLTSVIVTIIAVLQVCLLLYLELG